VCDGTEEERAEDEGRVPPRFVVRELRPPVLRSDARAGNRVLDPADETPADETSAEDAARRAASRSMEGREVRFVMETLRTALEASDEERARSSAESAVSSQTSSHKSSEDASNASSSSSFRGEESLKVRVREPAASRPRLWLNEAERRVVGKSSFNDSGEAADGAADGAESSRRDCEADVERAGGRGISSPVRRQVRK
jgi:hypothetical protein